jgi:hypothetical protein
MAPIIGIASIIISMNIIVLSIFLIKPWWWVTTRA